MANQNEEVAAMTPLVRIVNDTPFALPYWQYVQINKETESDWFKLDSDDQGIQ